MQNRDLKKIISYIIIFAIGYFIGDKGLQSTALKNLNLDNLISTQKPLEVGEGSYVVNYIVDGDTVHVKDKDGVETKIRFLAVNTLELTSTSEREKCLAKQEKDFTKENLLGKVVELASDPTQPKLDKYGRTLVYIKLASSTEYFNETLMKTGNAKIYRSTPPAENYQKYLDLQTQAQKQNLGIWNLNNCKLN